MDFSSAKEQFHIKIESGGSKGVGGGSQKGIRARMPKCIALCILLRGHLVGLSLAMEYTKETHVQVTDVVKA